MEKRVEDFEESFVFGGMADERDLYSRDYLESATEEDDLDAADTAFMKGYLGA